MFQCESHIYIAQVMHKLILGTAPDVALNNFRLHRIGEELFLLKKKKQQIVNILGFAGHSVSVATIQLSHFSKKSALGNT